MRYHQLPVFQKALLFPRLSFHLRVRPSMNPRPALPTNGKPISTGKKGRLLWIILGIVLCPVPVPTPVEFRLFVRVDRIG